MSKRERERELFIYFIFSCCLELKSRDSRDDESHLQLKLISFSRDLISSQYFSLDESTECEFMYARREKMINGVEENPGKLLPPHFLALAGIKIARPTNMTRLRNTKAAISDQLKQIYFRGKGRKGEKERTG